MTSWHTFMEKQSKLAHPYTCMYTVALQKFCHHTVAHRVNGFQIPTTFHSTVCSSLIISGSLPYVFVFSCHSPFTFRARFWAPSARAKTQIFSIGCDLDVIRVSKTIRNLHITVVLKPTVVFPNAKTTCWKFFQEATPDLVVSIFFLRLLDFPWSRNDETTAVDDAGVFCYDACTTRTGDWHETNALPNHRMCRCGARGSCRPPW